MKILMVCLGNICRSPLAEGILRDKARKMGVEITVDSAGTAAYHTGERPDRRSQEVAKKHGIDISSQRARQFTRSDFEEFDRIFVMDSSNYDNVISLAPSPEEAKKVEYILNMIYPGKDLPIPDPYYGGNDGFENVFRMLDDSCEKIIEKVKSNGLEGS